MDVLSHGSDGDWSNYDRKWLGLPHEEDLRHDGGLNLQEGRSEGDWQPNARRLE